MLRLVVLAALFCSITSALGAGDRKTKAAPVEVKEFVAHRDDGLITVDLRVRNSGPRPIRGLDVIFRFVDSGGSAVTTQRTTVDEPSLEPGSESTIGAQLKDAPRAVAVQILARDGAGAELNVINAGPFEID